MGKQYDLRYDYCKEEWLKRRTGTDEEWEHADLMEVAEYAWPPANPYLAALEDVAAAARAACAVLEQVQAVWLPDSHNVRAVLDALAHTLAALDGKAGG